MPKSKKDLYVPDDNWKKLLSSQPQIWKKSKRKLNLINAKKTYEEISKHIKHMSENDDDDDDGGAGETTTRTTSVQENSDQVTRLASKNEFIKLSSFSGLTRAVAMDCEMVGIGPDGTESILARVSIVNRFGHCIYDKYVKPTKEVTDYRTAVSGITPELVANGEPFETVHHEVAKILKGRILVGHSVYNDLKVLFINHPRIAIRDTSTYQPFVKEFKGRTPALKKLVEKYLNVQIQNAEHSSVQDAQATMRLYTLHCRTWEPSLKKKTNKINKIKEQISS